MASPLLTFCATVLPLMVGVTGFEPATLCSQSRCATKLRYTPKDSCPMHHHTGADAKCRARGRLTLGSSVSPSGVRGCSSMVEPLPSKQITRVRFPSSAPIGRHPGYKDLRLGQEVSGVAFSPSWGCFLGCRLGLCGADGALWWWLVVTSEWSFKGQCGPIWQEAYKRYAEECPRRRLGGSWGCPRG